MVEMGKGTPIPWTLDDLKAIEDGSISVEDMCLLKGCKRNTVYSMKQRIRMAGSPESLWDSMTQPIRTKDPDTPQYASRKPMKIRKSEAGRRDGTVQYTVTIPAAIAAKFVDTFGDMVTIVPKEDTLEIVPLSGVDDQLPSWLQG
jgi:hypothetical protein